jgi:hypothetical protein
MLITNKKKDSNKNKKNQGPPIIYLGGQGLFKVLEPNERLTVPPQEGQPTSDARCNFLSKTL